jgi:hypothetical protein
MTYTNYIYYAIGFAFTDGGPVYYSYVGMNGDSIPFAREGRFVFATDPAVVAKEVSRQVAPAQNSGAKKGQSEPVRASLFDIPSVLHMIVFEDIDPDGDILDALNMLNDYVVASPFDYPEGFWEPVEAFTDYLAQDTYYGGYFATRHEDRKLIVDTALWSVGAILANAEVIG